MSALRRVAAVGTAVATLCASLVAMSTRPAGATPIRCGDVPPISADESTYALGADGGLWAWGPNWAGQLGTGSDGTSVLSPTKLNGISGLVSVSAGWSHTLALRGDGTVWAWGYNQFGEVGDGSFTSRSAPIQVSGLSNVKSVHAGGQHSIAVKRDGTVWAWGRNFEGQLGDGTTTIRVVPRQIPGLTDVVSVSAGGTYTALVRSDGTVWTFGENAGGQLGRGSVFADYPTPGQVPGLSGVVAVSAGGGGAQAHTVALKSDGTVWSWGYGVYGQLGNNSLNDSLNPVQAAGLTAVTDVSAGGYFTLARRSDGTVWGWGYNGNYELGNPNAAVYQYTPIQTPNVSGAVAAVAGGNHAIALTSSGSVLTWGRNANGTIGDGTTNVRQTAYTTSVAQSAPAAPTSAEAVAGERLAYLTWSAPSSVVTQYVVTPVVGGVNQPTLATASTETNFAARNLQEGTTYEFRIAGQNCLGAGAQSAPSNRVVPTGVQLNEEGFKVERQSLTDRLSLSVNTFNGNLSLGASDLVLAGTGLDLTLSRAWQSRGSTTSTFGNRWAASIGQARLEFLTGDSVFYVGPGGAKAGFTRNADGSYRSPAGIAATLVFSDSGTPSNAADDIYTLTSHGSGKQQVFAAPTGRLSVERDRNGNTITYTHGAPNGELSSAVDTRGRSVTLAYNAQGLVSTVSAAPGRTYRYFYDASKNLTRYVDPANFETLYTYDASGNLTKLTTPAGRVIEFAYDAIGRVTSYKWALAPEAPTTTFSYATEKTVVTNANGKTTTYTYDPVGRTTGVTDALGNATSLDYTSNSNVRAHRAPGATTSFEYTAAHALKSIATPTGSTTRVSYDDPTHPHLPTEIRDRQGNITTYAYDGTGNLTTQRTPQLAAPNHVGLTYGAKGRVVQVRDMAGTSTSYSYDTLGHITGATPPAPLGAVGPFTYDAASRLLSARHGNGDVTMYEYDDLDRTTKVTYDDGSTVSRSFDPDGHEVAMTDGTGTTTTTWDAMGRVSTRTTPDGATVGYQYDKVGNLTALMDKAGLTQYSYNDVNVLSSVLTPDGKVTSFTYDERYNRRTINYPNGTIVVYTYDASDRMVELLAGYDCCEVLINRQYDYRKPSTGSTDSGLLFVVTDGVTGEATRYTYDVLNRLTAARRSNPSGGLIEEHRYTYDRNGNRTRREVDRPDPGLDGLDIYAYNAANQLVDHNGEDFTYDGNGNLTGSTLGAALTYTAANQTASVRPRPDRGLPVEHLYRGPGQSERTASGPMARSAETTPACAVTCVPSTESTVATEAFQTTQVGVTTRTTGAALLASYTRDAAGGLLRQETPAGESYFITDPIGSVIATIGEDPSTVQAAFAYDPFGDVSQETGQSHLIPWRFAGAYADPSGLYKMGERYYDPVVGRWTQQDPIYDPLDPKQSNRYAYVGNDPINFIDPGGAAACKSGKRDLFDFFDDVFDFFDDLAFTVGGLKLALWGLGTFLVATTPVGAAIGVAGIVIGSVSAGYGLKETFLDYQRLQSC